MIVNVRRDFAPAKLLGDRIINPATRASRGIIDVIIFNWWASKAVNFFSSQLGSWCKCRWLSKKINFLKKLYNIFHQELSGVGRRFEHQLTADAHHLADATSVGSKIICCYTLGKQILLKVARYYLLAHWLHFWVTHFGRKISLISLIFGILN